MTDPATAPKRHEAIVAGSNSMQAFDVERIRADFPVLKREIAGKPLVYLDNGASAQKPRQVIDAMTGIMEGYYANVHRGNHRLSQESTVAFEAAREKVAAFLNAPEQDEIIFTRGGTESINLVASSYGRAFLEQGDEIVLTVMEHHANIVPWQLLRDEMGLTLKVCDIDDDGNLRMDQLADLITERTKIVAVPHISNTLGTVVPVKEVVRLAHAKGAKVLLDGCQAVPHTAVDVQDIGCDFYVFSGHKLYGPTGIGVLWAPKELLDAMPPYQGGGEMIEKVTFERTTFKTAPHRFEAGTPAIVEAVGLGAAVDYLTAIGLDNIAAHEEGLLHYATERLEGVEGLTILGNAREKASIISFLVDGCHVSDVGTLIDQVGVAVRVGHHCAQPVMERFGITGTARASFGLYNTRDEIDRLAESVEMAKEMLS